jgi:uncharacterized membrane protein YphA (DoxX/SURF4 family)
MNIILWIIQILLALLFLFAGGTKLVMSMEALTAQAPPDAIQFSGLFIRFIGVVEVLGALGLVLPGLLRRNQGLTPLAALGLLIVMIGAVVSTVMGPGLQFAIVPLVVALLCAFVAYGRWKLHPHQ